MRPRVEGEWLEYQKKSSVIATPALAEDGRPGYYVCYPDGYNTWMTKERFESDYERKTDDRRCT